MEPRTELQRNALVEARRQELNVYQRALDIQWLNSRMEDGRMGRCLALIQREAEMEKDFQERTDHAAIVNARAERETRLGIEINKVRREEICQLLRRHYLRERDPSLKELAKKLQAGYVCRDIQQQILHNEYRRLQEKAEDMRSNNILLNALSDDKDAEDQEAKEKMQRTTQYCKELQQQLVNRQRQKQCQYEDSLIEKKMLEDIIRTMSDEDKRELQQKRDLTEKTRHEMKTFLQAREAWKQKQKEMVIIEERKIEEQNKMMADRQSAIVQERERRMKIKEEINEKMSAKILADEAARQERTNIIKLLQEQEYLEKNFQDDIAEQLKLEEVRRTTKDALAAQIEERKKAVRDRRMVEAQFRKETEDKIADDMRKEREEHQKRREKGKLYSQELLKQIQDNASRRKQDVKMEEDRAVYVWDCDRKWRQEVSKEREKMIQEHAPQLLGYLQAGVLQPEDLPAVRAGANTKPELKVLDIEGMAKSKRAHRFAKCNAMCRTLREY
uniref:Meiosis-specific nuclear structural protein 1 n=1 Tax=Heliothis virescens TaxID=7102 RepID=A0A2A4J9S4_HELVI